MTERCLECLDNVKSLLLDGIVGEQRDVVNAKKNCKEKIQDVFNREGFKLSINSNGSNGTTDKFICNLCRRQNLNGTIRVSNEGYTCNLANVDDFLNHLCMQQNWSDPQNKTSDITSENLEGITHQLAGIGIEAKVVVTANTLGQPAQSFEKTLHFNFRGWYCFLFSLSTYLLLNKLHSFTYILFIFFYTIIQYFSILSCY